jgi:hypothetical protein
LIRAYLVYSNLKNAGINAPMLPALEAHTRPLSVLKPVQQVEVWRQIVDQNGEITIGRVRAAVGRHLRGELSIEDVGDPIYASDNEFGIPTLHMGYQVEQLDAPINAWGSIKRNAYLGGSVHFYTDDNRFMALLNDPTPVVNAGVMAAVEPNFSIYAQTPRAVALYRIFSKRWIARWWQSKGISILVDLHVNPEYYKDNLHGVPSGWRSWATRGSDDSIGWLYREYEIACTHAGTTDILFVVFGGGERVQVAARENNWVHIREFMDRGKFS